MRFNTRHTEDLTEGPLFRQIVLFSLPLMLSNILQVLFNMSDIAVVGQFAGAEALGSVGSTTILVGLFTSLAIGMGSGVNVVTARFLGARAQRDVSETVHTALLLCIGISLLITGIGMAAGRAILVLLGTKEVLLPGAVLYLRVYLLGLPALTIYNYGNGVLSANGDTRRPLLFLSLAGVLNVLLNLFFVIVCGFGVLGVALASVLAQCLSAVLVLLSLLHSDQMIGLHPPMLRVTPPRRGWCSPSASRRRCRAQSSPSQTSLSSAR